MITIKLEGIDETIKRLDNTVRKQVPFAASKALNDIAKMVKEGEVETMKDIFDRPTPYILKGLYVYPSTKTRLQVEIYFKDRQAKLLEPHAFGGSRSMKRSEVSLGRRYYVPGKGARLNKYGNISPGQITQVLSVLKRSNDPLQNVTPRSTKRNKRPRNYFTVLTRSGNLAPGVWEKTKSGVKLILMFIKNPQYRKRFFFFETAQKIVNANLKQVFMKALAYAIRTSK